MITRDPRRGWAAWTQPAHYPGDRVVIIATNEQARVERVFKEHAFGPALLVVRLQTRRADGDPIVVVESKEIRQE